METKLGTSGGGEFLLQNEDEKVAVKTVMSILQKAGANLKTIHLERTQQYISMVAEKYYTFCRLKLSGEKFYMELSISAKDAKPLQDDSRFAGLEIGKRRFSRVPLISADDIPRYADVISRAYEWARPA